MSFEVNFDGLVGPTHNYSGLSAGNLASMQNAAQTSNPREAALQGLKKMALLQKMGLRQAVLPPHERPSIPDLRRLGFHGSDSEVLAQAAKQAPYLLSNCSSASPMWTANAGTTTPRTDTTDSLTHFTAANLVSKLHRSIEAAFTSRVLKTIFPDPKHFAHHAPLPATDAMGDEGAANHTRLAPRHGDKGLHLFVYGKSQAVPTETKPSKFPARQTREASQAVARLHRLPDGQAVFAQQNPAAIDAGVFHNDVISVGNGAFFFFHEDCFAQTQTVLAELQSKWSALHPSTKLTLHAVPRSAVSLGDTVKSYLFNSQLVTLPSGRMALIAPQECETTPSVETYLEGMVKNGLLAEVHYPQLRQSMQNGGGPACLRLRVVLTEDEIKKSAPGVFIDDKKLASLEAWVGKHYRDRLTSADLADPKLLTESRTALDALTQILGLGSLYPFQQA